MIIDIHAHTFPDKIAASTIQKLEHLGCARAYTNGTKAQLLDSMQAAGIDHSVILPVATNPVKAAHINDITIQETGKDGLIHFGCIHPDTPDAMSELARIAAAGIKGIKIHPVYQDTDIDDIRFLRILGKAGELGLIVIMHAGDDVGYPGRVRCSPAMTRSAILQAGPVKLICAHMGGWQNWDCVADNLADTGVYIDTALGLGRLKSAEGRELEERFTTLMDEAQFLSIVRTFGADRVLFGSDSPWSDQKESLEGIRSLALTQTERDAILGRNAARLLGL